MRFWQISFCALFVFLFTACSVNHPNTSNSKPLKKPSTLLSAQHYLQLANSSTAPEEQEDYRLLALERLVKDHKNKAANALMASIQQNNLTPNQTITLQLLTADLKLTQHQNEAATTLLNTITTNQQPLTDKQQIQLHELLAASYAQTGQTIQSLTEYDTALQLIKDPYAYNDAVLSAWQLLQNQNLSQLQALMIENPTPALQGWLKLAILTHQSNGNGEQLLRNLQAWRSAFSGHPAQNLLPGNLDSSKLITNDVPKNIAVLLPLKGALADSANAIRRGMLAAFFAAKNNYEQTPNLRFYDTTAGDVKDIYQTAINNGADFVVGPLTKPDVEKLIQSNKIPVPTLALNTVANTNLPNRFYQFGLSPLDEANQIAELAAEQQHTSALLLAPSDTRGQQIANTLITHWQTLEGNIVGNWSYTPKTNFSSLVQSALGIDQSQYRAQNLERLLGEKLRYNPRRRQDIDCIFLVAKPNAGSQIQPFLKYYFAGDLPIFATSEIFNGTSSNQDLEDIVFTDMPWVLADNQNIDPSIATLRDQLKTTYRSNYNNYQKLYGLGVDAYNVITELNMLALSPQFGENAATGTLYLDDHRHLYRRLLLAQIRDGQPRLLNRG